MLGACTCRVVHISRQLARTYPYAHEEGRGVDQARRGATDAVEAEPESIRLGNEVQETATSSPELGVGEPRRLLQRVSTRSQHAVTLWHGTMAKLTAILAVAIALAGSAAGKVKFHLQAERVEIREQTPIMSATAAATASIVFGACSPANVSVQARHCCSYSNMYCSSYRYSIRSCLSDGGVGISMMVEPVGLLRPNLSLLALFPAFYSELLLVSPCIIPQVHP